MNAIDAIAAVAATESVVGMSASLAGGSNASFSQLLSAGIRQLDEKLEHASAQVESLALGENVPPHQVMLALEDARLSLQFAMQVRARLVDAYQELMRTQI